LSDFLNRRSPSLAAAALAALFCLPVSLAAQPPDAWDDQFVSYFGATKAGQECDLRWVAGRRLETTVGGVVKEPIADKAFADEVFAIWLRDRPAEDAIRRQLISRAQVLIPNF
jgi:hypothetical protein